MATIVKTPYIAVKDQIISSGTAINANNNIYVIGKRSTGITSDLIPISADYPKLSLYSAYQVPSFKTGLSALNWLKGCGFNVLIGNPTNLYLPAPSSVTSSGSVYTLTYNIIPSGFSALVNTSFTASVSQGTSTGTLNSITSNGTVGTIILTANGASTFNNTGAINISYNDTSINKPNPIGTEPICMTLFTLFEELNNMSTQLPDARVSLPQVYITIMGAKDTGYIPNSASIALVKPDFATIIGNTVVLSYSAIPANWGLLPDNAVGNSILTQTTSAATGTFYQKGIGDIAGVGANYYIVLNNTTGTFTAGASGAALSVVLDATYDISDMITQYCKYWIGYHECNTTNAALNTSFFSIITEQNSDTVRQSHNGGYIFGFLGNVSQNKANINLLPNNFNSPYIVLPYLPQPYITVSSTVGYYPSDYTQASAFVVAASAMNDEPFNPTNDIVSISLNTSNSTAYQLKKGISTDSELAAQEGYTGLYTNINNQIAIVRVITSQLTLSTGAPDNEFFPITTQQIISDFNENVINALNTPEYKNKRKSNDVKGDIKAAMISQARRFEQLGMFSNVSAFLTLFSVEDDPIDPSKVIASVPIQIIPELNIIEVDVNIYSFLVTLPAAA